MPGLLSLSFFGDMFDCVVLIGRKNCFTKKSWPKKLPLIIQLVKDAWPVA
jgi:hypothetical protein